MNDASFADLEARLAPVPDEGGRGFIDRHDVLDLLAECRALRAFTPPALAALEQVSWVFECLENLRAEEGGDERLVRKLRGHLFRARGALLLALEARPAGAGADHEGGDRVLERVMANRAELERLRKPPDVAGLMTAAALENLHRYVSSEEGHWLAPAVNHIDALESLARELYGVVADLHADDPGRQALLERGRAEALEAVASACESPLRLKGKSPPDLRSIPYADLHKLAAWVRSLGPCRPPLPPQEAEREADRLREALRGLLRAAREAAGTLWEANAVGTAAELDSAARAARAALGEDTR
jgi:hypothetical protein